MHFLLNDFNTFTEVGGLLIFHYFLYGTMTSAMYNEHTSTPHLIRLGPTVQDVVDFQVYQDVLVALSPWEIAKQQRLSQNEWTDSQVVELLNFGYKANLMLPFHGDIKGLKNYMCRKMNNYQ